MTEITHCLEYTILNLKKYFKFHLFISQYAQVQHATAPVWESEDSLQESELFFYQVLVCFSVTVIKHW